MLALTYLFSSDDTDLRPMVNGMQISKPELRNMSLRIFTEILTYLSSKRCLIRLRERCHSVEYHRLVEFSFGYECLQSGDSIFKRFSCSRPTTLHGSQTTPSVVGIYMWCWGCYTIKK
jgi:hypothetical protein